MSMELTRREVLGSIAVGVGALALPAWAKPGRYTRPTPVKPIVRLAHLTDIHIQPERAAAAGLAACLAHVQERAEKPDLIVTGGDLIMDAFARDASRTRLQWELLTKTFRDHCGLPVQHALGNHDIWGWNKKESGTTGSEALWGKRWALDTLGLDKPYRGFDAGSWRVVLLDSVQVDPADANGYIGQLDPAQMDWLDGELGAAKGRHVLIVSHIPILSVTPILGTGKDLKRREVSNGQMHVDSAAIRALFEKHGNVRACVSGHMHRLERLDFRGVSYFCNGAVCGAWWKGPHHEANEGYAVLDLFDDGRVEREYVVYGWNAKE